MPSSFVERKITGKMRVRISGSEEVLRNPLFAINWFDTRVALVYHFYNLIAAPRVFKVGGKALFKGQYQETIYGNPDMQRKFLLIVNYPSANRFLDLAADKIFQVFSVFRIAAVKRFSFVLDQRHHGEQLLTDRMPSEKKEGSYAVVQLSQSPPNLNTTNSPAENSPANSPAEWAASIGSLSKQHNVEMFFAGTVAGRVSTVDQDDQESAMPTITEHTFVFSASSDALSDFLKSNEFRSSIGIVDPSDSLQESHVFAATLKRLM